MHSFLRNCGAVAGSHNAAHDSKVMLPYFCQMQGCLVSQDISRLTSSLFIYVRPVLPDDSKTRSPWLMTPIFDNRLPVSHMSVVRQSADNRQKQSADNRHRPLEAVLLGYDASRGCLLVERRPLTLHLMQMLLHRPSICSSLQNNVCCSQLAPVPAVNSNIVHVQDWAVRAYLI